MAEFPGELYYAQTHEWARIEDDGTITVGISDHAQDALGDVVFVELPEVGASVQAQAEAGVVESVKAASDIFAPVSGTVTAINESLEDSPETVNQSPFNKGWMFTLQPDNNAQLSDLMDAKAYQEFCEQEEH